MTMMSDAKHFKKTTTLSIFSSNCLNLHSPLADCHICSTVCPQNALSFHDGNWSATNCSLCGICAMVCPTQVFQIDLPQLINHPTQNLTLCCSQNTSAPTEALRINCIQQLNPLAIIHLLYRHPSITIYLSIEQCHQCTHQWYAQGLVQQLSAYQLPPEKLTIITQEAPVQAEGNHRRDLFRDLFHRTEDKSKQILVQAVETIGTGFISQEVVQKEPTIFPSRLPLYALYIKNELPMSDEKELPFRQLNCTACTFCGACVHICPTQALEIKTIDDQKQLLFHPELCINCNLCKTICMQHGLEWEDYFTVEQFMQSPIQLAYSPEHCCSICSHEFYQWPSIQNDETPICVFCR